MRVLVLNPGSSSLKATLLEPPSLDPVAAVAVDWGADATAVHDPGDGVAAAIRELGGREAGVDAVGYRVVHGGDRFVQPVLLDDAAVAVLRDQIPLAPLHNPVAVEVIEATRRTLPDLPHVAAFDTAFHASLSPAGYRYPVPPAWFERWGVRRYGFHGLSVAWSVRRAGELLHRSPAELRLVVAHLGSGCSVTAVDGGRSVDTSMGMTPLEGLMMGTRAGSIDPGILLRLLRDGLASVPELEDALDHGSGLAGVSGRGSDVRALLRAEAMGDDSAALALELFVRRAAQGIAAAASCLTGLDALVFTGGIGENSHEIRSRIAARLAVLHVPALTDTNVDADALLSGDPGGPAVLAVRAREDVVIADAVEALAGRS